MGEGDDGMRGGEMRKGEKERRERKEREVVATK